MPFCSSLLLHQQIRDFCILISLVCHHEPTTTIITQKTKKTHLSLSKSETHTHNTPNNSLISRNFYKKAFFALPLLLLINPAFTFPIQTPQIKMLMNSTFSRRRCNPIQIQRLRRKLSKKRGKKNKMVKEKQKKMLFKNLELYLENQNIMQENKKLRERAALLIVENKTLSSQLQKLSQHQVLYEMKQ